MSTASSHDILEHVHFSRLAEQRVLAVVVTRSGLVRDRVLQVAAEKTQLTVPEERLIRMFAEDQNLAAFRDAQGKIDPALFQRAYGQTPDQYVASVRAGLATQQVLQGVAVSAFATKAGDELSIRDLIVGMFRGPSRARAGRA